MYDHYLRWVFFFEFGKKTTFGCHLNECPELLCGLSRDHRWSLTIPMGNSPWEKRILQSIIISLGLTILCDDLVDLVLWDRVKYLSLSIDIVPQWILWEKKQRGLIPPGLQSWPFQLIEHLTNTTSVAPIPGGPAGCHPLYLLHLLYLSFTIWAPNRCCILQFRDYQSFVCNLHRCKSQVSAKKT